MRTGILFEGQPGFRSIPTLREIPVEVAGLTARSRDDIMRVASFRWKIQMFQYGVPVVPYKSVVLRGTAWSVAQSLLLRSTTCAVSAARILPSGGLRDGDDAVLAVPARLALVLVVEPGDDAGGGVRDVHAHLRPLPEQPRHPARSG